MPPRVARAWLVLALAPLISADALEQGTCSGASCGRASGDEAGLIQTKHPSSRRQRPNIVYMVADQWRWDWAGFHDIGMEHLMPNLRKLAKLGTRFNYAYSPSPLCTPSRCSFVQGVHFENSFVQNNGVDCLVPEEKTYLHRLEQAGYTTMISGKDHLSGATRGVGINGSRMSKALGYTVQRWRTDDKYEICSRDYSPVEPYGNQMYESNAEDFDYQAHCYGSAGTGSCCTSGEFGCDYESPVKQPGPALCGFHCPVASKVDELDSIDAWTQRNAEKLVEDHLDTRPGTPWYISVGFPSPHPPFILSPTENETVSELQLQPPHDNRRIPPELVNQTRRQYAGNVLRIDYLIGKMVAFLREKNLFDNTLIIVSADHGEHAGDWGQYGKMSSMEPSVRVPMVVVGPGVQRDRVVDEPVETLDLVATMLDFAGTTPQPEMETRTMRPFLTGAQAKPPREQVTTGIETTLEGAFFHAVIQKFPHRNTTFKLVCCYFATATGGGCLKQGPFLPPPENQTTSAVTLMSVDNRSPGDVENLMQQPAADRPCAEAWEMMQAVPWRYGRWCAPALETLCGQRGSK